MYKLLFPFIILLFLSCNKNKQVDEDNSSDFFDLKESVNLPLSEIATHQGHFINNKQDYFYSYNMNTNNLFIYDKIKVLDSVNLSYASANQIIVKNLDSIFIIDYTNRLIRQLNFNNKNIKTIDFHKLTNQDTLNPYLFNGKNLSIDKNNIIFDLGYTNSKSNRDLSDEQFRLYYNESPRIGLINNNHFFFSDLSSNDVRKLSGKSSNIKASDYANVTISDEFIVLSMQFFNQLYIFDKQLRFIKAVPITSKYTGTDINIDFSVFNENSPSIKDYDYATLTKDVVYDKVNKLYYVLLAHKTDIKNKEKLVEKRSNRPFSVLVYNDNFNLIKEQRFKKNLHEIYLTPLNVSSRGELIINANNSMNPNFSKNHLQYNIYEVKTKP